MRKKAFTLAEVLITLGIIGVVAAMTIPTLLSNAQSRVFVSALRKGFTTVGYVYKTAMANDHSDTIYSTNLYKAIRNNKKDVIVTELRKYIKTSKICTPVTSRNSEWDKCFNIIYVDLHNNDNDKYYSMLERTKVYSNDGIVYYFAQMGRVEIDVNGDAGPNQLGRDLFVVEVAKNGTPYFRGSEEWLDAYVDDEEYKDRVRNSLCDGVDYGDGGDCGAKIQNAGWKMDY